MQPFVYTALPAKVIFGFGTLAQSRTRYGNWVVAKP